MLRNNKNWFTISTSSQRQVEASCETVWDKIHDFPNFPKYFSTVYVAESIGDNPKSAGHKVKITRLLPSGHCFQATYTIVHHDEEAMECQSGILLLLLVGVTIRDRAFYLSVDPIANTVCCSLALPSSSPSTRKRK